MSGPPTPQALRCFVGLAISLARKTTRVKRLTWKWVEPLGIWVRVTRARGRSRRNAQYARCSLSVWSGILDVHRENAQTGNKKPFSRFRTSSCFVLCRPCPLFRASTLLRFLALLVHLFLRSFRFLVFFLSFFSADPGNQFLFLLFFSQFYMKGSLGFFVRLGFTWPLGFTW